MPEQSLKWSESIDGELARKMKLRQAVWCAERSHQVVLTLQRRRCSTLSTAFKFFQLAVQRGPCKNHSDNPYGHTPKRKHALYSVKNKFYDGPVFVWGIAQQTGWMKSIS